MIKKVYFKKKLKNKVKQDKSIGKQLKKEKEKRKNKGKMKYYIENKYLKIKFKNYIKTKL